ncbi:hypothetical protein [Wolbachia endosymbiont (group A) of Conops quadrifasciatus]|uniref:hypothetical protein n=1 Tax=Wolbachia endosymbiont (group A) of Conops quadrifasciatus TaxID=3066143 RepID=UPI003132DD8F
MEEHKRVIGHINNLHMVFESLDPNDDINWEQIGEALDFGNDQEKVFTCLAESIFNQNLLRESLLSDSEEVVVKMIKFLEFFYQKTPEKFLRSLFGLSDNNKGGFTFLFRNDLENLKGQPESHKLVNDFIQKIDEDLNEYASKKLIEEQRIEDAEHIRKLKEQETETAGNTYPVPTTGNKTTEKNDTTFWSEHKGKIALGVTGLCVAGAVAAYVLAYPAVALALAVLAAIILMGAGIAKVLEDPSVEKQFTPQQGV